jgi:hypothetical protein
MLRGRLGAVACAFVGMVSTSTTRAHTLREAGTAAASHEQGTATLLSDGRVLVAGGYRGSPPVAYATTAEVWDPKTETFTASGVLPDGVPRCSHAAVRLLDGRVALFGGSTKCPRSKAGTTEVALWADGVWSKGAPMPRVRSSDDAPELGPQAILLPDGRVLVVGGFQTAAEDARAVDLYDPKADRWTTAADLPSTLPVKFVARAASGRVMLALLTSAGAMEVAAGPTVLYDPASNTWSPGPTIEGGCLAYGGGASLESGRVLVTRCSDRDDSLELRLFDMGSWQLRRRPSTLIDMLWTTGAIGGGALLLGSTRGASEAWFYDDAKDVFRSVGTWEGFRQNFPWTPLADGGALLVGGYRTLGSDPGDSLRTALRIERRPNGAPCTAPETCASGACSAGACTSTCARDADCAALTYCKAAACTQAVAPGAQCASAQACATGHCLEGWCCQDEKGCGAYTCSATGCRTSCAADGECAKGFTCASGACLPSAKGAKCTDDQLALVNVAEGKTLLCAPYLCDSVSATCRTYCASQSECQQGYVCSSANTCLLPQRPIDASGCASPHADVRHGAPTGLALLALLVARAQRAARRERRATPSHRR